MFRFGQEEYKEDENIDRALRPQSFDDYVGQEDLKKKLTVSITAATERNEALDHLLLFGPPGLGKTTIAMIISKESGVDCQVAVATNIKKPADLIELLCKIKERDILFIDEIHALNKKMEETLYSAMEDYKVGVKLGNKEMVNVPIRPFCLVGATTEPGKMQAPLRDRFGICHTMQLYQDHELATIVGANANKLGVEVPDDAALANIAKRSRGTPRIANRLLRRARDYAQVYNNNVMTYEVVDDAMRLQGVDEIGLTGIDYKYLTTLMNVYKCGPVGVQAMAATLGADRSTVESYIEPYLIRLELLSRTQSGRMLTPKGMEYVMGLAENNVEVAAGN